MLYLIFLLVATHALTVSAATAAQWRTRSIYQVLTDRYARTDGSTTAACNLAAAPYCGGTWQGIINKLDYIQNMGFTAIWISPVTQQIPGNTAYGTAFHGYWQNNINALNSNFGTASDLKALSAALHARGMYLMVDVVVNHFAWPGAASTVDYSTFTPFNSASYFHKYCPILNSDYTSNQTAVESCWLGDSNVELVDMDTTNSYVINTWYAWVKNLVSTYSIDGLRIDTVRHVQQSFWSGFNSAAGVYCVGEVFSGDQTYVCPYQNVMDGLLNYPLWYPLTQAFQSTSGNMASLVNMVNYIKSTCKDSTLLGTFLENHDNDRFPSLTGDIALDQNAIAFTILADGVPIIYEGQEQHYSGQAAYDYNREAIWPSGYSTSSPFYGFIGYINQMRNHAIYVDPGYVTYKAWPIYSDTTTIAMRKGSNNSPIIGVFTNKGSSGASYSQTIGNTGYSSGATIVEMLACQNVVADSSGNIVVATGQGAPKIFYPAASLTGSGICGH